MKADNAFSAVFNGKLCALSTFFPFFIINNRRDAICRPSWAPRVAFVARAPLLNSLFSLTIRRVSDRKYMYSSYSFIQNQEENDTTLEREREREEILARIGSDRRRISSTMKARVQDTKERETTDKKGRENPVDGRNLASQSPP